MHKDIARERRELRKCGINARARAQKEQRQGQSNGNSNGQGNGKSKAKGTARARGMLNHIVITDNVFLRLDFQKTARR